MEDFDIPAVEAATSRLREIQLAVIGADRQGFQMNTANVLVFLRDAHDIVARRKADEQGDREPRSCATKAMAIRPKVGGFPYLAETLRRAGVTRNIWSLPSAQSLFITNEGSVVALSTPLASGTVDVPPFDREALIAALRTDQAGNGTFPEFLAASWRAGVIRYDVDFIARTVSYYGSNGEEYVERYPAVEVE
jgi:uncharacterized protein YbcV (DUF1398 family)